MQDIVSSVAHVFDIMGEIASASDEQSRGISQIAQAVSELDTTTQQNAALVEESSSAANSLEEQSRILAQAVSAFHLGDDAHASGGTSVSPALLLGKPGHHGKKPTFRKGVGDKPTDSARHPPAEGEWMRF